VRLLKHRVATLETKAAPQAMHIVFAIGDEAAEQARARYGKPIGEDDLVVLIRKPAPSCLEEGTDR
jgi:hypothetical protein